MIFKNTIAVFTQEPVTLDILSRQRNILEYYAAPNNEATIYPRIFHRF